MAKSKDDKTAWQLVAEADVKIGALEKQLREAKAEIKSNREDYNAWRARQIDATEHVIAQRDEQRARADKAEYKLERQVLRVDALLFALVLAQQHAKLSQDIVVQYEAKYGSGTWDVVKLAATAK